MQFKLSADDIAEIEELRKDSPVCQYLQNASKVKFTIGDILIKRIRDWDCDDENEVKWKTERISGSTGMVKRYVYVYEDENGVGFVKNLKTSTATLGKDLYCLADMITNEYCHFVVDPEFMDSVLMGDGSFSIKEQHKAALEKKNRIKDMNQKSLFKPTKLSELNAFFEKLKVGDKFWTCDDLLGTYIVEYTVLSAPKKRYVSSLSRDDRYDYDGLNTKNGFEVDDKFVFKFDAHYSGWGDKPYLSCTFCDDTIYSSKPLTVDDQV